MSEPHVSPLLGALEQAGGVFAEYHGRTLARHFGDPHGEYEAATKGAAVFDRSHRTRLRVDGRAPRQMLNGILTGTIPSPPERVEEGVLGGVRTYHAVLTPKGKMVTDLWCAAPVEGDEESFLLDVPVAGRDGLAATLARVLPPRLARAEDVSAETAMISVVGPEGAALLSRLALGLRVDAGTLGALPEGAWRAAAGAGSTAGDAVLVARSADVWPEAYDVVGPAGPVAALWRALTGGGARPAGLGVWSTLRIEAGRPVFGTDMDQGTIPVEAGIQDRAIDHTKGCYTGQEVIVRIRDRGHVNRHLRQLMLGDVPTPSSGTELFVEGRDKSVGEITSAVSSPRFDQTVALAYVRRGVEGEPRPR